jgi:hypothetical protein
VPLSWVVLLWRKRRRLDPEKTSRRRARQGRGQDDGASGLDGAGALERCARRLGGRNYNASGAGVIGGSGRGGSAGGATGKNARRVVLKGAPTANHRAGAMPGLTRAEALAQRESDDGLGYLAFLFDCYEPSCFWFEPVEMYRRVAFISILPLVSASSAKRAAVGIVFALVSLAG